MGELHLGSLAVENITDLPAYKRMERAGRICYQSQHMMKEDSAPAFIRMIRDHGHYSVLGHSQLLVSLTEEDAVDIELFCPQHLKHQFTLTPYGERVIVGAGFDSWLLFFEQVPAPYGRYFAQQFPDVFGNLQITVPDDYEGSPKFGMPEAVPMTLDVAQYMFKETYILTVDRATAMQLRTYRFATHSVESQRYVNYMKRGFTYLMPPEVQASEPEIQEYWRLVKQNEMNSYEFYIKAGYKPEFARTVLGQDIQTQMAITCSLWEWRHIFHCRLNSHTQSNARDIVQMVKDDLLIKYKGTDIEAWLQE